MEREDVAGEYKGSYRVREGREDELTKDEVKRYLKSKENLDLELRPDGTFSHKGVSHGTWTLDGERVYFQPTCFGKQTYEEMRRAAEESGRMFSLAFLFDPFELRLEGSGLVTPDDSSLIFTTYERK